MTKTTYNKLMELKQEYLIEFIKSIEEISCVYGLRDIELSDKDIMEFDKIYDRCQRD